MTNAIANTQSTSCHAGQHNKYRKSKAIESNRKPICDLLIILTYILSYTSLSYRSVAIKLLSPLLRGCLLLMHSFLVISEYIAVRHILP